MSSACEVYAIHVRRCFVPYAFCVFRRFPPAFLLFLFFESGGMGIPCVVVARVSHSAGRVYLLITYFHRRRVTAKTSVFFPFLRRAEHARDMSQRHSRRESFFVIVSLVRCLGTRYVVSSYTTVCSRAVVMLWCVRTQWSRFRTNFDRISRTNGIVGECLIGTSRRHCRVKKSPSVVYSRVRVSKRPEYVFAHNSYRFMLVVVVSRTTVYKFLKSASFVFLRFIVISSRLSLRYTHTDVCIYIL